MQRRDQLLSFVLWIFTFAARAVEPATPIERLDEVHQLVREEFFDPELRGVDWDAARRRALARLTETGDVSAAINAMLGELETSHTRYLTDAEPAYFDLLAIFEGFLREQHSELYARFGEGPVACAGLGVFTREVDGRTVVSGVLDGGPAEAAGILRGDVLLTVDGEPWEPLRPFVGKVGETVAVRVERRAGEVVAIDVEPRLLEPATLYLDALRASTRVEALGEIEGAYVHVWSYAGTQYQELLEELVLHDGPLAHADALVIDLREGWGGANPSYLNLFNRNVPLLTSIPRGGEPHTFDSQWRKPVVLLIDGSVRSGKEALAHGFRKYGIGPVVGTRTAGAVTAGGPRALLDGGLLYLAVADVRVDGERLEGRGVAPDVEVAPELLHAAGRDPQKDRAFEIAVELVTGPKD